ncbi:MAG: NAD(P)/FAD-dependent oxidoreductase [Vulcanimicrobiaceae bacterium]
MRRVVCVIGGGMLGLDLARRFAVAGDRVEVWESSDYFGGLAAPWRIGNVVWDRYYHVIAGADTALLDLLQAIDVEREVRWVKTQTGFYTDGRLHRFSTLADFAAFPALNPAEKLRLGLSILYASRVTDWQALERITAVEWLTRLSGRSVVRKIWLPLLRAKLGDNAERVSAAFIWTIIRRMYGAREGAAKQESFGYVPGGYARILSELLEHLRELGVTLRTKAGADKVVRAPDGRIAVHRGESRELFDEVVLTVPAAPAANLCPDLSPGERNRLLDIEYQGVVCASLLLKRPPSPYYITNITDAAPFTAVIEMDALVGTEPFLGNALAYLPKYVTSSDPIFEQDDATILDEFSSAFLRMYPALGKTDIVTSRVSKARFVLPLSTLEYSKRVPPFVTSIPGLYVANSTQIVNGTLNVNQTLTLSQSAMDAIVCDRLRAPQPSRVEACA